MLRLTQLVAGFAAASALQLPVKVPVGPNGQAGPMSRRDAMVSTFAGLAVFAGTAPANAAGAWTQPTSGPQTRAAARPAARPPAAKAAPASRATAAQAAAKKPVAKPAKVAQNRPQKKKTIGGAPAPNARRRGRPPAQRARKMKLGGAPPPKNGRSRKR